MKRLPVLLLAVLLVAALIRAYGIGWGLPEVYEEATPLKKAWDMWGWGPQSSFDLNPHFFNYPSLAIYLQFLTQAGLYAGLQLGGAIDAPIDFRALYKMEPTAFYLAGRGVTSALGVLAVLGSFLLGRRLGGPVAGAVAAGALALNPVHVARGQAVEVDVPLTAFVALALWAMLRALESSRGRPLLLAGAFVGVAAATKYTGALLLIPLVATGFLAAGAGPSRRRLYRVTAAATLAGAVFFLASPYVILDFASFREDFALERRHMELGHFGTDASASWLWYGNELGSRLAGWPALLLALCGAAWFLSHRRRDVFVVALFVAVYYGSVGSFSMKAPRYALPLLPALFALAGLAAAAVADRLPGRWRLAGVAGAAILVIAPPLSGVPAHLQRLAPDTRTLAKSWFTENVPRGALVASEAYGPGLFTPLIYMPMEAELKRRVDDDQDRWPLHALQQIPMFQVQPELSARFYRMELYEVADYVVVTGSVRSRYERDPKRFSAQLDFYRELAERFPLVQRFDNRGRSGSVIEVYGNPSRSKVFAERGSVHRPVPVTFEGGTVTGEEAFFHYNAGINYEMFGYGDAALISYSQGLAFPVGRESVYINLVLGGVRCLLVGGRKDLAVRLIDETAPKLKPGSRGALARLRASLVGK